MKLQNIKIKTKPLGAFRKVKRKSNSTTKKGNMQRSDLPRIRDQKTIEEILRDSEGKHFNLDILWPNY